MSQSSLSFPSALVLAGATLCLCPGVVRAQSAKPELHIDVATHAMPGMPGMGALDRMAGAMGGFPPGYG